MIHGILPRAEECISYSMPAFRHDGRVVAGFLATAKGCSYFPFSGSTLATLAKDVERYDQTKSALHFDPARGIPSTLIRKLLNTRVAETAESERTRPRKSTARKAPPKQVRRAKA